MPVHFFHSSLEKRGREFGQSGDHFFLWSLSDMRRRNLLLVDARHETSDAAASSLLSSEAFRRVEDYLSTESRISHEVLAAASFGTTSLEAIWTDLDGSGWEPFLEMARQAHVPGGALCVLPLTTIDTVEFYLLEGKRPNEKGEVPIGGAY